MSDAQTPAFVPMNPLEQTLQRAHAARGPLAEVLRMLASAQVVMLLDRDVGAGWDPQATPLVIRTADGGPGLAVFTATERAVVWLQRFPQFECAWQVGFEWVLKGAEPGTAILVNPGWDEGFMLGPDAVAEMKAAAEAST